MTQRLLVSLGRTGDIINLLPLLWDDAQKGHRSAIMVAKEFAGLLDGISYADPYVFNGECHELDKAMEFASTFKGKEIVCCQTAGPKELLERYAYGPAKMPHAKEESFQKTAWRMAGRLEDWKRQLPLVFDRRNREREKALTASWHPRPKHILVALDGKSSPFPYKDLCLTLLKLKFQRGYEIHDVSQLHAERIYDLLGCFERAHCLVAADSAPIHLAYACEGLPVVALINDRPLLWNGSVWRPNHIAHIRYSDFPRRCVEMLDAIEGIGQEGCWFNETPKTPRIIHVWSQYEIRNQANHLAAKATWQREYGTRHWVSTPIEPGTFGRDTRTSLKDERRVPFLRDGLRMGILRAGDGDIICLTRQDTCFTTDITAQILKHPLSYSHRTVEVDGQLTWHPAVDLFCMPKAWWQAHQKEMPDMVLGLDPYWPRVLMELMKKHGAKELPFAVYKMAGKEEK